MLVDYFHGRRIEIHQSQTGSYYAIVDWQVLKNTAGRRRVWKKREAALRDARRTVLSRR